MKRRGQEEAARQWARAVLAPDAGATAPPAQGAARDEERREAAPRGEPSCAAVWSGLELPAVAPVPAGFARRVAGAWAAERERATAPLLSAVWMRAAAAAALLAGVALGSSLSARVEPVESVASVGSTQQGEDTWTTTSLSEQYLAALAAPEAALATAGSPDAPDASKSSGTDASGASEP